MKTATLTRGPSTDEGTFGTLVTDSGFTVKTGELPWRDNKTGISCIPEGLYLVTWRNSPSKGMCYHVESVPGRTDVEIHAANWMGDKNLVNPNTDRKYLCELLGCIAPGVDFGQMTGQKALVFSKNALISLERNLNQESFRLTIKRG